MPVDQNDNELFFRSAAVPEDDLRLVSMTGRDALSTLFEFDLVLESASGPLERARLEGLLDAPAHIGFGRGDEHPIHGVLRAIEMQSFDDLAGAVAYRAVLVPALWTTTQTFRSRVYQETTAPGIVQSVLLEAGLEEGRDFDFYLDRRHPRREYVVQYQETDYQFLARLLEHEGIFFFFEHSAERAKLIVADTNARFGRLAGHDAIAFDPRAGALDRVECIAVFAQKLARIPREMHVRDYNYRTPSVALQAHAPIDDEGEGVQVYYGEHFADLEDGRRIARLRAEEVRARRECYTGRSVVRSLRSGARFRLEGHSLGEFEQDYVITEVTHSVDQSARPEPGGPPRASNGYANTFVAIPLSVAYRPPRTTPKPRILGLMHARIDGERDSIAAPIDAHGRYRVLLPFDTVATPGGHASRWIRMAQPHAGSGYGMHFPLYMGTEVVIAHLDGDPDRPIIVASVPNHETATPAHETNATQAVIRTRTGITMRFENATRGRVQTKTRA